MIAWFKESHRNKSKTNRTNRVLSLEFLEDRATPTVSAITSNFNGTSIPTGNDIWFSSVGKVSGLNNQPAQVQVTDQTIRFSVGSTEYTLPVPDSTITFDPALSVATTTWTGSSWAIAAPPVFSGNVLLGGLGYQPTTGLPGGIKNVTWQGNFTTSQPGISLNWKWTAAVYTQLGNNPNDPATYGVKTTDDSKVDFYRNSDHAGTPQAFKKLVVGGARGGGGSNYTGSYSGTAQVVPDQYNPPLPTTKTSSLSGFVTANLFRDGVTTMQPLAGVALQLVDSTGVVAATTFTGADGSYSFKELLPGSYRIQQVNDTLPTTIPVGGPYDGDFYLQSYGTTASVGTINGQTRGVGMEDLIDAIQLGENQMGVNYNFENFYTYGPYFPNT